MTMSHKAMPLAALPFLLTFFFIAYGVFMLAAPAFGSERFTDNGDGTVTDTATGLMWAHTDNQGNINWKQADQWVKYTFAISSGYDGWRLPTAEELKTLYLEDTKSYPTDCGHEVKLPPQIRLSCGWVWTAERKSITAKMFNFARGHIFLERTSRSRGYRALPVRSVTGSQ